MLVRYVCIPHEPVTDQIQTFGAQTVEIINGVDYWRSLHFAFWLFPCFLFGARRDHIWKRGWSLNHTYLMIQDQLGDSTDHVL